jgi:hypothetical protein
MLGDLNEPQISACRDLETNSGWNGGGARRDGRLPLPSVDIQPKQQARLLWAPGQQQRLPIEGQEPIAAQDGPAGKSAAVSKPHWTAPVPAGVNSGNLQSLPLQTTVILTFRQPFSQLLTLAAGFRSRNRTARGELSGVRCEDLCFDDRVLIPKHAIVNPRLRSFEASRHAVLGFGALNRRKQLVSERL